VSVSSKLYFYPIAALAFFLLLVQLQQQIEVPLWDGRIYAEIAKNPLRMMSAGVTAYQLGRIVPPVLVGLLLRLSGIAATNENVILAFAYFNVLQLALASYFLARALRCAGADERSTRIVTVLGLGSFFLVAVAPVYSCLTDVSAFLVGCAMISFYLSKEPAKMLAVAGVGTLCWPLTVVYGLPLLLFSVGNSTDPIEEQPRKVPVFPWYLLIPLLAAVILVPALCMPWLKSFTERFPSQALYAGFTYLVPLVPLSALIAIAYISIGVGFLFAGMRASFFCTIPERMSVKGGVYASILFVVSLIPAILGSAEGIGHEVSIREFLYVLTVFPLVKPAIFLVSHTVFLGPVVCFAVFLWPSIAKELRAYGPGAVLTALITLCLSLDPESRHLALSYPLLLPFVGRAMSRARHRVQLLPVLLICCITAWPWVPMTEKDFSSQMSVLNQRAYLSRVGPWMTNRDWLLAGLATVLVWGSTYACFFRRRKDSGQLRLSAPLRS
jgi:hypothetical protein